MPGQDQDDETGSSEEKADEVLVTELSPHDVLLGRGTGPNEHQGNKILRSLVAKFQEEYDTSKSRKGRHDVAMKTLQEIKKNEGRFLDRAASLESSSGEDEDRGPEHYLLVDDKKAINKIKQAFRYNIQTTKYSKRDLGESLQEEFHDNKRIRLLAPASPAGGRGGFEGASSGELPLPAHHNYRTTVAPNIHPLGLEQQFLQRHPFVRGQGLIRDPIPPSQLARLDQRSINTAGLARLDQRLGVGIGAARSMMEFPHHQHASRPSLYAGLGQQPLAYEASLAASRIPLGGVGPFLSSLASTQSFGARSPHGHYPLTIASAPVAPSWLRIPAALPPTNHQLRGLARDILLPPSAVHPLAAAYRPFLSAAELVPDRRESASRPSEVRSRPPSEVRSNDDAVDRGEEYRIQRISRSAYD
jgi:hypothetical protein